MVTVAVIKSNPSLLVCGCAGKLYGVNLNSGTLEWKDGLRGLGYAQITISSTAYNIDFNSSTLPQFIEMIRKNNN